MKWKKEAFWIVIIFIVVAGIVSLLFYTKKEIDTIVIKKPKGISVESQWINIEPLDIQLNTSATLDALSFVIYSEAKSEVQDIYCSVGDVVPVGSPFLTLTSTTQEISLDIAKAKLDKAALALYQTERRLHHSKKEWKAYYKDVIYPRKKEQLEFEAARQDMNIAQKYLQLEYNNEKKLKLMAQEEALVLNLLVSKGQEIDTFKPLVKVCHIEDIRVVFFLDRRMARYIKRADEVVIRSAGGVHKGKIRVIDPMLNPVTRLVQCEASYNQLPSLFFIGEFSEVAVNISQEDQQIYKIPRETLRVDNEVFIIRNDKLVIIPVDVMYIDQHYAYIQSDKLQEKEELVVSRIVFPRNNMSVER